MLINNKLWLENFNEILDIQEHLDHDTAPTVPPGMGDFKGCINFYSLLDMSYQGSKYTWCNKRLNGLICKKLDRVLMNGIWMHKFSQPYSVFEAGGCSDHLWCRVYLREEALKPLKPFQFTYVVAEMLEFVPMVEGFWNHTEAIFPSTSALFHFSKKAEGTEICNQGAH